MYLIVQFPLPSPARPLIGLLPYEPDGWDRLYQLFYGSDPVRPSCTELDRILVHWPTFRAYSLPDCWAVCQLLDLFMDGWLFTYDLPADEYLAPDVDCYLQFSPWAYQPVLIVPTYGLVQPDFVLDQLEPDPLHLVKPGFELYRPASRATLLRWLDDAKRQDPLAPLYRST